MYVSEPKFFMNKIKPTEDKELANSTLQMIQKNKLLNRLKLELDKMNNKTNDDLVKNQNQALIRRINKEIEDKNQWRVFEEHFEAVKTQIKRTPKKFPNLIISGDYNICHQAIDIHNPKGNEKTSGFLPEERAWLDGFMKTGMIDTFRHLNKEPHNYSWWSYRAKEPMLSNKGRRLDHIWATPNLNANLQSIQTHKHFRSEEKPSDHVPIETVFDFS